MLKVVVELAVVTFAHANYYVLFLVVFEKLRTSPHPNDLPWERPTELDLGCLHYI